MTTETEWVRVRLYRGNQSIISRLIKWQTRGPYSHAAIIVGNHLYEAKEFVGTRKRAAVRIEQGADDYIVAVTAGQHSGLTEWLERQVGKPYDYTMVARFVTRRQESRRSSGKWFCSELVFAAFLHVGTRLLANTEPWEVSPSLLGRSTEMRPLDESVQAFGTFP